MTAMEQAAQQMLAVLEKTVSHNPQDQRQAVDYLTAASTQDFALFVQCLSMILRTQQCQSYVRQAAGLQLKNVLSSKNPDTKAVYLQRWLTVTTEVRTDVKEKVLGTLGTEPSRPSIAAQCVSAIACAEIPSGLWPNAIQILMSNVTTPGSGEMLKESSLEALGYICQEIDAKVLELQANDILTAIVHGMQKDETSIHVRLAATNALSNSLEFSSGNFANEPERNIIMQVVCESTQSTDSKVKVASLQCMSKIMALYYPFMDSYMGNALFPITMQSIKSDDPDVSMQGMEFWSTVAEVEIDMAIEEEEAALLNEDGQNPQPKLESASKAYVNGACQYLCPVLLVMMAKHEDDEDDDDWSPSKAAGVCLMLVAQCVRDAILECVTPFFNHFNSDDWKYKEAAIYAFASILDGPSHNTLAPLIRQALPLIIQSTNDSHVQVRDTAAYAIGRVIDVCPSIITEPGALQSVLPALSVGLHQEPRVAVNICWTLVSVVKAVYDAALARGTDASGQPDTFELSAVYEPMISELIKVTERTDGNQQNLRIAAYEALMELIKHSPKDCYATVQSTTHMILKKLEQLLTMEAAATTVSDKSQLLDLQALMCATLQSVARRMKLDDLKQMSEPMMGGLLQIMQRATSGQTGNVMEEALVAVSTLIEVLRGDFIVFMDVLKPHLLRALKNHEESQVCGAGVGVVTDLCRALEKNIAPYLDEIVQLLLESLQSSKLARDVKVMIMASFSDVALAIENDFERYVQVVVDVLNQAQSAAFITNPEDIDQVEYVDRLREACLSTYTGVLQGLRPTNNETPEALAKARQSIGRFVTPMCEMIIRCCDMEPLPPSENLMGTCSGLIGDLVVLYSADILPLINNDKVNNMIAMARKGKTGRVRSMANWASKEIRKAMNKAQTQQVPFNFTQ